MRKIILSLVFLFLFTTPALAHNRGLVLGDQTKNPVPPLSAGPGLLLPNSPFWGLDVGRDELRLFLTVNANDKVMLATRLAGERLAELKVLLTQPNPRGIDIALEKLASHVAFAREILQSEKAKGKDVSLLAHDLNEALNEEQDFLDNLVTVSGPGEQFLLRRAQVLLTKDEILVENELAAKERENETLKELLEGTQDELGEASQATRRAQELNRQLGEKTSPTLEKILGVQTESWETANDEVNKLLDDLYEKPDEEELKE